MRACNRNDCIWYVEFALVTTHFVPYTLCICIKKAYPGFTSNPIPWRWYFAHTFLSLLGFSFYFKPVSVFIISREIHQCYDVLHFHIAAPVRLLNDFAKLIFFLSGCPFKWIFRSNPRFTQNKLMLKKMVSVHSGKAASFLFILPGVFFKLNLTLPHLYKARFWLF